MKQLKKTTKTGCFDSLFKVQFSTLLARFIAFNELKP